MSLLISFHPAEARELVQVADYRGIVCEGLGPGFIDALERATNHSRRRPKAAPIGNEAVRRALLERRFLYSALYSIRLTDSHVIAAAHHQR